MPVKRPKKGLNRVIVEFGHGLEESVKKKGSDRHARIVLAEPPSNVDQETDLVCRIKKLCENNPQTPVLLFSITHAIR